ncbi:hypothetical protein SD80_012480 [Scytonema tolypothrichoides VB-61278]|nr:hypothetical protein SD80_012480 [Scytonema tolypothrichoides VB-61278]
MSPTGVSLLKSIVAPTTDFHPLCFAVACDTFIVLIYTNFHKKQISFFVPALLLSDRPKPMQFLGRKFTMKTLFVSLVALFLAAPLSAFARDVHVDGYYRKDGTYVRPHVRSAPDGTTSNNYGPSRSDSELMNPQARDNDNDGTANYLDTDDDNDSVADDHDGSQYGQ